MFGLLFVLRNSFRLLFAKTSLDLFGNLIIFVEEEQDDSIAVVIAKKLVVS